MSLEEKKNLAWSQEQTRNWNSTSKEPLKPKQDAATSFINSNLKSLSSSKTMDSYPSLNSMPSYSPNMSNMNMMSSNLNMSPQPPLSLSGSYSSFMSSPSPQPQSFVFQSVPPGPSSLDLRSLDSLLPNIGTRPSLSMSQMSSRPIAPVNIVPKIPSPPSYSSPVSSSAKNELDDLLG